MGSYHARVIANSTRAELHGIVEMREEVGKQLAEKYNASWYPELPSLTGIDAVIVAAPTEVHFGIAESVLNSGIPLLLEKPLTTNLESTSKLIELSEKQNIPLMCGFLERFNPAVMTAMQLIENPLHISTIRHSPYAPRIQTGVSWDLMIHDVDLIAQMMSGVSPVEISGSIGFFHPESIPTAEDVAESILHFENGTIAQSSVSRIGHRKIRTMVVNELDKLTEIDLLRRDVTVYRNVSAQIVVDLNRGYRQQTVIEIPEVVTSQEPLAAQFDHFLDLIKGKADSAIERTSLILPHQIISKVLSSPNA